MLCWYVYAVCLGYRISGCMATPDTGIVGWQVYRMYVVWPDFRVVAFPCFLYVATLGECLSLPRRRQPLISRLYRILTSARSC